MQSEKESSQNYTTILKEELVAAMGCTEPIAIAYAAAKAYRELGEMPEHITVSCSGNIIKNVKGVTVPNSGGQKGIETAAVLGMVGGDASKILEVIADVTDEDRKKTSELRKTSRAAKALSRVMSNRRSKTWDISARSV